jgi:hypothetical protein
MDPNDPIIKLTQSLQKLTESNIQNTFTTTGPVIKLAQNIQNYLQTTRAG